MAADHKENEGEIINYCIFWTVVENATFPSSKIDKVVIEQHFNRRKGQDKIILGSAFFWSK